MSFLKEKWPSECTNHMSHSLSHPEELTLTLLHFPSNQKPTHRDALKSCQIRATKLPANNKVASQPLQKKINPQNSHSHVHTQNLRFAIPSALEMWKCRHCRSTTHGPRDASTTFNTTDSPKLTASPNFNKSNLSSPSFLPTYRKSLCLPPRTLPASHRKIVCCQTSSISVLFYFP